MSLKVEKRLEAAALVAQIMDIIEYSDDPVIVKIEKTPDEAKDEP